MVGLGARVCVAFILARSSGSLGCLFAAVEAGIPPLIYHSGIGGELVDRLDRIPNATLVSV